MIIIIIIITITIKGKEVELNSATSCLLCSFFFKVVQFY